jgi:predicted RNA binding protein YcfA (HicA-like mRNA interferase family)
MAGLGKPRKVREVIADMRAQGWKSLERGKGSHEVWGSPCGRHRVPIVVNHLNAQVSRTVLQSLKRAGFAA